MLIPVQKGDEVADIETVVDHDPFDSPVEPGNKGYVAALPCPFEKHSAGSEFHLCEKWCPLQ